MVNRRRRTRTRIPKLKFDATRNVGWHVSYRDPQTGHSRRHRFRIIEREREREALALYHAWVAEKLGGNGDGKLPTQVEPARKRKPTGKPTANGAIVKSR